MRPLQLGDFLHSTIAVIRNLHLRLDATCCDEWNCVEEVCELVVWEQSPTLNVSAEVCTQWSNPHLHLQFWKFLLEKFTAGNRVSVAPEELQVAVGRVQ